MITNQNPVKFLAFTYVILLLVMFILPFLSFENYTILKNTTSHLGAQNAPNAWVMNLVFILLGISSVLGGWQFLEKYWFHKIVLLLFGASLILVAIYSHAPIDGSTNFNVKEDELHSLFAKTTGWSFTIFAAGIAFVAKKRGHQILAILIAALATLFSILMFYPSTEHLMGIWQRLIFIFSFGWMLYAFGNYELKVTD